MIKVLQVSQGEEFGGIEKFELDIFKNIDKNITFDFLTPNSNSFNNYEKEIKKLGGNFYNFNLSRKSFFGRVRYFFNTYKFIKKSKYDVVHINSSVFLFSFQIALISKLCGVKNVIVHGHSSFDVKGLKRCLIVILNPIFVRLVDRFISCSSKAALPFLNSKYLNRVTILKDGIEVDKFKYNGKIRKEYRKKLKLEDKIVFSNVSRFDYVKNHDYLIDLFYEIAKREENAVLVLVGDGKLRESIENKVKELGLSTKVLFLGFRDDVCNLYNAFDVFLFPSLTEGFGISLIEAQTNGLTSFASNTISDEVKISNNLKLFNLKEDISKISDMICSTKYNTARSNDYKNTIKNKCDIKSVSLEIEKNYKDMIK